MKRNNDLDEHNHNGLHENDINIEETHNHNDSHDLHEKHRNKLIDIIILCSLTVIITVLLLRPVPSKEPVDTPIDENRFEIIYEQTNSDMVVSGGRAKTYIVADRETDVEYLLVITSYGVGITTMRDTNGMVLLRE